MANLIEILPDIPESALIKRVQDLIVILKEKVNVALVDFDIDDEEDQKKVLVCNNGTWLLGEIANKVPDQIKDHLVDIINILGNILNTDIINQLTKKNEQMLRHFAKTISITLGRLG